MIIHTVGIQNRSSSRGSKGRVHNENSEYFTYVAVAMEARVKMMSKGPGKFGAPIKGIKRACH